MELNDSPASVFRVVTKPAAAPPFSRLFSEARFSAVTSQRCRRLPPTSHSPELSGPHRTQRWSTVCLWRTTAHNSNTFVSLSIKSRIREIGLKWMCSREKCLVRWGLTLPQECVCAVPPHPPHPIPQTAPLWGREGMLFKNALLSRWRMSGVAPFFIRAERRILAAKFPLICVCSEDCWVLFFFCIYQSVLHFFICYFNHYIIADETNLGGWDDAQGIICIMKRSKGKFLAFKASFKRILKENGPKVLLESFIDDSPNEEYCKWDIKLANCCRD